tara:strand:+ start:934 stop:1182 length:249 start_codon:yes stop_codon:yes gene_type:complete
MPLYTFQDTRITDKDNDRIEISMRISELDDFKLNNPHMLQKITGAPSIGDAHRLGRYKPDDGFRDVLRNVKHHHKKNNINTW